MSNENQNSGGSEGTEEIPLNQRHERAIKYIRKCKSDPLKCPETKALSHESKFIPTGPVHFTYFSDLHQNSKISSSKTTPSSLSVIPRGKIENHALKSSIEYAKNSELRIFYEQLKETENAIIRQKRKIMNHKKAN